MTNAENPNPIPDEAVAEEMELIVDGDLPSHAASQRSGSKGKGKSVAGAALGAMMLGLGEIMEPSKTADVAIEQAGEEMDPEKDILANFEFGDLPPLN